MATAEHDEDALTKSSLTELDKAVAEAVEAAEEAKAGEDSPTEKKSKGTQVWQEIQGYFFMLIGCLFYGGSTSLFLAPNSIVAGGVSGLAVLLNTLNENLPIGMLIIALNIPILVLGIKFQGWKFIFRCLLTIVTLGVVTDLLAFFPATWTKRCK